MDIKTIDLEYPVLGDGVEIQSLAIRRPKVRDRLAVERMSGTEAEKEVRFVANLCEVAPEHIEALDLADYSRVQEALSGFFS